MYGFSTSNHINHSGPIHSFLGEKFPKTAGLFCGPSSEAHRLDDRCLSRALWRVMAEVWRTDDHSVRHLNPSTLSMKVTQLSYGGRKHLLVNKLIFLKVAICLSALSCSAPVQAVWRDEGCWRGCLSPRLRWAVWASPAARPAEPQIAAHQHSFRSRAHLIVPPWATALQLSPDRHGYLASHANKMPVRLPPTGARWPAARPGPRLPCQPASTSPRLPSAPEGVS